MMSILQISTADLLGGAENVAMTLFRSYRKQGHRSSLAVGCKSGNERDVIQIPNDLYRSDWSKFWISLGKHLEPKVGTIFLTRLVKLIQRIGDRHRLWNALSGYEDFEFPGSWHVLESVEEWPDIVHCHNLHGNYFDLRALPWLSGQVPVVLTLHDAWLLSGHCAHSLDCERWKIGCGQCPYLMSPPAILRDGSSFNWHRKKGIYSQSSLYIATPCEWLMQKVKHSMLCDGIQETRVIPNGINLSVFCAGDKRSARIQLEIPEDAEVMLFVANGIRLNFWKDFETIRAAISSLSEQGVDKEIVFIALGEHHRSEKIGRGRLLFVPYKNDPVSVSRYYQAADIYLHASFEDTFPTSILEALACGVPVIATGVGGIPEQIRGLDLGLPKGVWPTYTVEEATGVLVKAGDSSAMAIAARALLSNRAMYERISANAAKDAIKRFDGDMQAAAYLEWFSSISQRWSHGFDRARTFSEISKGSGTF